MGCLILQFFLDNGTTLKGGMVTFDGTQMSKIDFEDGIRKLSNGRFKVTQEMFLRMTEFMYQKQFPLQSLPWGSSETISQAIPLTSPPTTSELDSTPRRMTRKTIRQQKLPTSLQQKGQRRMIPWSSGRFNW